MVLLMADPTIVSNSDRTSLGFEGRGLTYSSGPSIDQNHDDARLAYAASSLIDMYPKVRVVVDLFELTSMKFMNQRFFDWSLPPTLWPPYASGSVFSSAMFDTMLCQTYFNHTLIEVVTRLAGGHPPPGEAAGVEHPVPGVTPLSPPVHRTTPSLMFSPRSAPAKPLSMMFAENDSIMPLKVPQVFFESPYKNFLAELVLTKSMLPLAIYRSSKVYDDEGCAPHCYVITNPAGDMPLKEGDVAYVMGPRQKSTSGASQAGSTGRVAC